MHAPKRFVAAISAVSLIGAASFALAQTTPTQPQAQTGNSGTMQRDGQISNPSGMTNNSNNSTQRTQDSSTTGMGTSSQERVRRDGSIGTSGTNDANRMMRNDATRSSTDGSSMPRERSARADRN